MIINAKNSWKEILVHIFHLWMQNVMLIKYYRAKFDCTAFDNFLVKEKMYNVYNCARGAFCIIM